MQKETLHEARHAKNIPFVACPLAVQCGGIFQTRVVTQTTSHMRFASEDVKQRYQDVVTAREMWSSQRLPSFLIAGGVQRQLQRRIPEKVCRIATACK